MKQLKNKSGNRFPFISSKTLMCAAVLSFLAAAKANAQTAIFTDGFEGVSVSGATANSGGATGNSNLNIAGSSWSSTGAFTTFTGNAPTAPTSLALSNSSATTQTWTLNVPMATPGYADTINKITYQYRATGTSYNFLTVRINGTTVSAAALNTNSAFNSVTTSFTAVSGSNITVEFIFSGGTHGTGGTMRLDNVNLFGGVFAGGGSGCTGAPSAAGSITVAGGITAFCGTGAAALSLTGATTGSGIHYQWEKLVGGTYVATGAADTLTTYNTGSLSATTSYKVKTSCGSAFVETTPATITINAAPANAPIGAVPNPAVVGNMYTLTDPVSGGTWSSANTNIATINASGVLNAVYGGTATISYITTNGTCSDTQKASVNVVWPNTLALYAGANGSSTAVIPGYTTETLSNLSYTGTIATGSNCTTGGLSGMKVDTTVTAYSPAGPHVFYKIKPTAGNALNVFRIAAKTRESGTGPTKARIAFSLDGGATWATQSGEESLNTGGSCGASGNNWSLDTAVNGITDSILVAVFPYASGANTGTFQLNTLEVYGSVTSAANCTGTPVAGFITPTSVNICDSGSRFLSLDSNLFTGAAGVGISYQWNMNGVAIPGATNISYNTGKLFAPAVVYYTVTTTCKNGSTVLGTATSNTDTVNVNSTPTVGIISNLPTYSGHSKYAEVGTLDQLTLSGSTPTGVITWSSNDTSSTAIDNDGNYFVGLPGVSVITALNTVGGCTSRTKDTIFAVQPNTIAAYTGLNGTSKTVTNFKPSSISVDTLIKTGYGTNTPCGFGGLSGLTNAGVTAFSNTSAHVYFQLGNTSAAALNIDGFHATVRSSATGLQTVTMAYSLDGGATWIPETTPHTVEFDDCGYSTIDKLFGESDGDVIPAVAAGSNIQFGLFAYNPSTPGGTFQVNTMDITSPDASMLRHTNHTGIASVADNNTVSVYPNPASTVLNIAAAGKVSAVVMGLDGKILMSQSNATTLNISQLANGMYFIKVYDENNILIKTQKFTKK